MNLSDVCHEEKEVAHDKTIDPHSALFGSPRPLVSAHVAAEETPRLPRAFHSIRGHLPVIVEGPIVPFIEFLAEGIR